ncbi:MAG: hypothetical protein ACFBSF_00875 [Leptolyngbyaceae cyanobacterium]
MPPSADFALFNAQLTNMMFSKQLISVGLCTLGFATVSLPAAARPEIASGDQWLEGVSQNTCLTRADDFISELDVPADIGEIDRTGYFDDGVFRILCYSSGSESSMLLVFTSHNSSADVAAQFMQFALESISQTSGDAAAIK